MHIRVHTSSDNAYNTYISAMYNFTFQWTWNQKVKIYLALGSNPRPCACPDRHLIHCAASIVVRESIVTVYYSCFTWRLVTYAGPAAPPAPTMMSPARASTWIPVKLRSAGKQALEARMWQHTLARLRNSPVLLERLLLNRHRLGASCWA